MKSYATFLLAFIATVYIVFQQADEYKPLPVDKKELVCLTHNVYFEARGEDIAGKFAVARVTQNRLNSGKFGSSICEVVKQQRNEVCQFSWWCSKSLREMAESGLLERTDSQAYIESKIVAEAVLSGAEFNPVGEATYYHAVQVSPGWKKLEKVAKVGKHVFYKERDAI